MIHTYIIMYCIKINWFIKVTFMTLNSIIKFESHSKIMVFSAYVHNYKQHV